MMVLVGCSNKQCYCPAYPELRIYEPLEDVKLKIKNSGSCKENKKSLEKALSTLAVKSRKQKEIIKAYKQEVEIYNKMIEEDKKNESI